MSSVLYYKHEVFYFHKHESIILTNTSLCIILFFSLIKIILYSKHETSF